MGAVWKPVANKEEARLLTPTRGEKTQGNPVEVRPLQQELHEWEWNNYIII